MAKCKNFRSGSIRYAIDLQVDPNCKEALAQAVSEAGTGATAWAILDANDDGPDALLFYEIRQSPRYAVRWFDRGLAALPGQPFPYAVIFDQTRSAPARVNGHATGIASAVHATTPQTRGNPLHLAG